MARAQIGGLRPVFTTRSRESVAGWLFVAPWLAGFILLVAGPMLASAVLSLTSWDIVSPAKWVGLQNYRQALLNDPLVWHSLRLTTVYAVSAVPLQIALGLFLAVLLNQKIRFQSALRTIYYLPSVLAGVAVAILWRWIFSTEFGLINVLLRSVGVDGPSWLRDPFWVIVSFVLMSLWGVGGSMLINLAGLQSIPTELYEAAEVDGAGALRRFRVITLPMMSPVIFFNTVMGIIAALQIFTQPFIMTGGGPQNASLFFMLYLYDNAFTFFRMGYASALAWILFTYIMLLTLLVFRFSAAWVHYEGSLKGR